MRVCAGRTNTRTSRPPYPLAAVGRWLAGACSGICSATLLACGGGDGPPVDTAAGQAAGRPSAFIDATAATGLDFRQFNGMSGAYLMAEVTGSGVALQDFDNDGDLDAYFVQGTMIGGAQLESATFKAAYSSLTDRVYRNDLTADGPSFVDVTEGSGLTAERYGMGVAAGDFDDDGQIDLYVTNVGSNQLLRNNTDSAGVDNARWSGPAASLPPAIHGSSSTSANRQRSARSGCSGPTERRHMERVLRRSPRGSGERD